MKHCRHTRLHRILRTVAVPMATIVLLGAAAGDAAATGPSFERLSIFAGMGGAGVVSGADPAAVGRVAFDVGARWQTSDVWSVGVGFNHFRFRQEFGGVDVPLEVNDLSLSITGKARRDGVAPYATAGAGLYFTDDGGRADVLRAGAGIEVPLRGNFLLLEGRLTSYGAGAFVDDGSSGRGSSVGLLIGVRFPLSRTDRYADDPERLFLDRTKRTLTYVATNDEKQELRALDSAASAAAYADAFWDRRDPYPELPGNAARELHERRVAATARFAELGKSGWATERGRALIVHGSPDEILWENRFPRPLTRSPTTAAAPVDLGSSSSLELWIYYKTLPSTTGSQSFFLFEEDSVSRYGMIWTNVSSEIAFGRSLPPLPVTISSSIDAGT